MDTPERVEAVRSFNRFYTRQLGLLDRKLLRSPYSLAEARLIYELAHREDATASILCDELNLDAGYLSRIVAAFRRAGLIASRTSRDDRREMLLSLTQKGRDAFALLNQRSKQQIQTMLDQLTEADQTRLIESTQAIRGLLDAPAKTTPSAYLLRPHQPGDMGWVVHRHGVLYSQEYGWDERFEALVAEIVAKFIQNFDPKSERCWIAEMNGENVGCVFLVKKSQTVGQLRLLLVEPKARGLGIGLRLVNECIRFARHVGYRKIMLWTNSVLDAARHIYIKTGFELVEEEPHHSFGHDLIGQNWELRL
jgi:DNA-binding MarR family transcriptional regulator/N-acetylglutamate synthase-like GNAT family acetyltransferase